ncbi:MAG TPA: TolC family protein [Sulfurimonas sp.]|uniref:TolC family protein n=1 Tax=Sulfurimonas sp. TaxID=2022749 RepID=UPI002D09C01D|nr:TolC family protein [Sulfurimonas sp.]HUH42235.1 TolC family protein [Sulfurimonas sp.]
MKKALFLLLPALMFGESLKEILEYAQQNNSILESKKYMKYSKESEVASKKSAYYPKIGIGTSYQNISDASLFQIKDTYALYGKFEVDIYDGGVKSALHNKAKNELLSSVHDELSTKESLSLEITKNFYTILSLKSRMKALLDAKASLGEQLDRVKQFYEARLATEDDVQRLQAAYDKGSYEIESLNFEIMSAKGHLELSVAKEINTLEESNFKDVLSQEYEQSDDIKSLIYQESAIKSSSEAQDAIYYPNIKLEDTYTKYEYGSSDANNLFKIDKQNIAMISLNMTIYDNSASSEAKQALILNAKALNEEIKYRMNEQKTEQEIALQRINSQKLKIKSAKSSLAASSSAFATIEEKYKARIVDYITYLDALSTKTEAVAIYEGSLYELQSAYAIYYFYSGKKLEEFIE